MSDDRTQALAPIRVGVVTIVTTRAAQDVVAELRRSTMQVDVLAPDVLREPPLLPVYVFSVDASIGQLVGERIVAWSAASELRPGVIALVQEGAAADAEAMLALGFDDVVLTPLSVRELAARVKALHRRVTASSAAGNGRLRYGDLTLDVHGRAVWCDGRTIALTSIELAVMRELVKARGKALSRIDLLDHAWGEHDLEVSERAVDNVVLRLRRKLPRPELIETVRGVGFRLAASSV